MSEVTRILDATQAGEPQEEGKYDLAVSQFVRLIVDARQVRIEGLPAAHVLIGPGLPAGAPV